MISIDDFLKQLRDGTIKTTISIMDYYDNFIKDNPYYKGLEDFYDWEEVMEESCNKQPEEKEKENNRYIKALKYRYDNRKENLDYQYIYMYEIYYSLINLDLDDKFCICEIQILIDDLEKKRYKCKSYNSRNLDDLIEDLKSLKDDFIIQLDSFDSYLDLAINAKNNIIDKYFMSKEIKYKKARAEQFIKRKSRKEEYLKLLNSDDYINKKIKKSDIAKMLGVSPAAVTKFCKRHGII